MRHRLTVFSVLLTLPLCAANAQTFPTYDGCIAAVEADPISGLREAESWANATGSNGAKHCQALALAAIGDDTGAAYALERLAEAMTVPSAQADLFTQGGEFFLDASDPSNASRLFDRALLIEPDAIEALDGKARAAASVGDFVGADRALTQLLWIVPRDVEALSLRAAARRQSGNIIGASADAAAAVAADPLSAIALFERGAARAMSGDLDGARKDWLQAAALDSNGDIGALARENLGNLPR